MSTPLAQLAAALAQAHHVAVLTGAGVSAESGLPTFRDAQTGMWASFRPEELATRAAFRRNPRLVWDWYALRRRMAAQASPNPAHVALARLAGLVPQLTLITQNVDGLHARAGSPDVIELHGNISRLICASEGTPADSWREPASAADPLPVCAACGDLLRPAVVWFGESLPVAALEAAWAAAQACDLLLSIGTSGLVYPAAGLPAMAHDAGATVAHINLDLPSGVAGRLIRINGRAGEVLPALLASAFGGEHG